MLDTFGMQQGGTQYGTAVKWFSPIHPVVNGNNESQNNRCRLAQSIAPVTVVTACNM
jgi:hypothetical protein